MKPGLLNMVKKLTNNPKPGEGSSSVRKPPTMWEQMKDCAATDDFTKNLKIEGSTVHMRKPPSNTISREKLLEAAKIMELRKNKDDTN